jgi:hypothetical protein
MAFASVLRISDIGDVDFDAQLLAAGDERLLLGNTTPGSDL